MNLILKDVATGHLAHCGAALVVAVLLTACGGGSGTGTSSNGGTATPPPAAPQPTIKTGNAETIGRMVLTSVETALMFADEAAFALRKFDGTALYQHPDNCSRGSARYLLTDNDQDGVLSVGDQIRTDYASCETTSAGGTLFGDLYITLDEIDTERGADDVRYVATVDAGAVVLFDDELLTAERPMTMEFQRGIFESQLTVSGEVDVSLAFPSSGRAITADWQSMTISRREYYETADYEVLMTGAWRSNILSGATQVSTVEPLAGPLNTWPTSGRIDVAGADGSGLRIRADGPGPGDFAVFSIDEDGDGTFTDLDETRDWENLTSGYLWWFELSSPSEFAIRTFDPNDFRILAWRPHDRGGLGFERTAPNPTIRILTSRAIDPTSVPDNLRLASFQDDWPFIDIFVDVDLEVRGAMILIRPLQQLAFGTPYRFPEEPFQISDLNGNTAWVSEFDSRIRVVDELVAMTDPAEAFGFPGEQLVLDSAGSVAESGSISSFDWSQVLGTASAIAGNDQPNASITLPATTQTELLRVNLQVTNEFGEIDFAKTDITLFPSAADIDLIYVRGLTTAGEWREWYLTPANGEQQYSHNNVNQLYITHDTDYVNTELSTAFRQNWRINIEAPTGTQLVPGRYDDISRVTGDETEPGFSITGDPVCLPGSAEFEVLEFTTDQGGQPDTIAVDFSAQCELPGEFERVEGSIRLRSELPPG